MSVRSSRLCESPSCMLFLLKETGIGSQLTIKERIINLVVLLGIENVLLAEWSNMYFFHHHERDILNKFHSINTINHEWTLHKGSSFKISTNSMSCLVGSVVVKTCEHTNYMNAITFYATLFRYMIFLSSSATQHPHYSLSIRGWIECTGLHVVFCCRNKNFKNTIMSYGSNGFKIISRCFINNRFRWKRGNILVLCRKKKFPNVQNRLKIYICIFKSTPWSEEKRTKHTNYEYSLIQNNLLHNPLFWINLHFKYLIQVFHCLRIWIS